MSILIKGMEMPKKCRDCACVNWHFGGPWECLAIHKNVDWVELYDKCPDWCPLVEVPTPHGRLIDADELMEIYQPASEDVNEWEHYTTTISVIRQNIKDAPTVIEAEEGEGC